MSTDTKDVLLIDSPADHVTRFTLNRPDDLNTMTAELCEALHEGLRAVETDRHCRAVILTGAGRGFCAGLDLGGYGEVPGNDGTDPARDHLGEQTHMSRLVLRLRHLPQPVIAAVNGPAAGFGLSLVLASDLRYAVAGAVCRVAFFNVGVSNCDMGTSWLLPRLVGAARAQELMLTGRRFDAEEAMRIGLIADVFDDHDALNTRSAETATQIAAMAPWGVRLTKEGLWAALEQPSMRAAIEYEDRQQVMATYSVAVSEAVSSFLEKRPANYPD